MGRDARFVPQARDLRVSIHAPARGATSCCPAHVPSPWFQSTRPQGARRSESPSSPAPTRFNPRARKGRDRRGRVARHAGRSFNPRARKGRDCSEKAFTLLYVQFQSTRPQGARLQPCRLSCDCYSCFNPRARKGRDLKCSLMIKYCVVSIHAPARGATFRA